MKCQYLRTWQTFIDEKKLSKRVIEQIPTDVGKEFPYWAQNQDKKFYKGKPYSHEYINSITAEVKLMYMKFAVKNRFISNDHVPEFERLRVQPDAGHKRDILTEEEWLKLTTYMRTNEYLKPEGRTPLENANEPYSGNTCWSHTQQEHVQMNS